MLARSLQCNLVTAATFAALTNAQATKQGHNERDNMSFGNKEKVTWNHLVTLPDGHVVGISDRSGIMKITFPDSYLTIMCYFDQFQGLGITNEHLVKYVNDNAEFLRDSKTNKQVKKMSQAKQKLVNSILDNPALNDDQKQAMLKLIA